MDAQTRRFVCGDGQTITLTVTGPNSLSAAPVEGATLQLEKSPSDPLFYTFGDYSVKIAPNQAEIDLHIADFGTLKCRVPRAGATPQAVAEPRGCEEGFKLVNGRCERLAEGEVDNPCGPGMRPVPETDRCVPLGTSATNELLPMWGRSFGGIVREGPSMTAPRLASVAAGDRIQILKGMDAITDGYDWFAIEFDGRRGYQWGGIMCSEDPLPSILAQCER